jgi:hypothetical protein
MGVVTHLPGEPVVPGLHTQRGGVPVESDGQDGGGLVAQFGHTPVVPGGQTFGLHAPGAPLVPGLQRQLGNVPIESDGQACGVVQFGHVPT